MRGKIKLEPGSIYESFLLAKYATNQWTHRRMSCGFLQNLLHKPPKPTRPLLDGALKKPCKQMNLFPLSAAVWYKSNVKNNKQPSWSGLQFKSFGDLSEDELQPHVWEQRGTANMFTHKILVFLSRKWLKRISAPHWYEGKYPNSFFHNLLTCFPVDGDINPVSFYKNLNMRSGIQQPDPS